MAKTQKAKAKKAPAQQQFTWSVASKSQQKTVKIPTGCGK